MPQHRWLASSKGAPPTGFFHAHACTPMCVLTELRPRGTRKETHTHAHPHKKRAKREKTPPKKKICGQVNGRCREMRTERAVARSVKRTSKRTVQGEADREGSHTVGQRTVKGHAKGRPTDRRACAGAGGQDRGTRGRGCDGRADTRTDGHADPRTRGHAETRTRAAMRRAWRVRRL